MQPASSRAQWAAAPTNRCQPQPRRQRRASVAAPAQAQAAAGRVYRATCPLVGLEALAESLGPLYPDPAHLHHYVVLEVDGRVWAYDFLPADPTSPLTAARLLSGGSVPGALCGRWIGKIVGRLHECMHWLNAQVCVAYGSPQPDSLPAAGCAGEVRSRTLRGVPRQRCQLQGSTRLGDPHAAAEAFQQRYNTQLQLLRNDCTHHASQLVAHLLQAQK